MKYKTEKCIICEYKLSVGKGSAKTYLNNKGPYCWWCAGMFDSLFNIKNYLYKINGVK